MIPALTVLHIALAAAWFGHKLIIPGDIRATAGLGEPHADLLLGRVRRAQRVGQITGIGTLLSGGGLMWAVGIETVDAGVWIGLALVVAAIALGAIVARPATKRLTEAVVDADRVAATIAGGQITRVLGLESLLWLGALTAMVL